MNLTFDFNAPMDDINIGTIISCVKQNKDIDTLTINISSNGGSVLSGITIYNFLKQQPFKIVTHNSGEVSSSAILLYLAGEIRTASEISKFIIHPLSMGVQGELPYYKISELIKSIDMDVANYLSILNKETNSLQHKYDAEEYLKYKSLALNKSQAIECGLVTDAQYEIPSPSSDV